MDTNLPLDNNLYFQKKYYKEVFCIKNLHSSSLVVSFDLGYSNVMVMNEMMIRLMNVKMNVEIVWLVVENLSEIVMMSDVNVNCLNLMLYSDDNVMIFDDE